ncbi:MAG: hypothetical protein SFX73_31955 [Kofleriaceae bacterium]|nr:hypothetical protein [Kofleriaceae bacterium]
MKTTLTNRSALVSFLLALIASTAAADAHMELQRYAGWVGALKADYARAVGTEEDPIGNCKKAIADGRADGMRDSDILRSDGYQHVRGAKQHDGSWQITFAQAPNVCDAAAYWLKVAQLQGTLSEAQHSVDWLAMIDVASNHEENGEELAKTGKRCSEAIERALADGIPGTMALEVRGMTSSRTLTIDAAKSELCAKVTSASETFAKNVTKEREARYAAIAAPYQAAGATGERLEYLVAHHHYAKYGVGGNEVTDVKKLVKAKVLFEVLVGQGVVTVRRREFKGDKLVGTTTQDYERRPGRSAFR